MPLKLNRINKFYGGITNGDKDASEGVGLNFEELDIFSNPDFMQPETILAADESATGDTPAIASGTPRRIWGYTLDDADSLYALSDDAAGTPKAKIWKLTTASVNNPGAFSSFLVSAQNARGSNYASNIIWHGWGDPITTGHLYYVTGTNALYKYGDLKGTPSETSVGTLNGLTSTSQFIPMIRASGELFIGHGQFIANVDGTGVFSADAFTLPNEWECVAFAHTAGDELAILARNIKTGVNVCRVFFWDMVATTGTDDEVSIPMGGPQAIVNHNEILRVFCARDNKLRVYELQGKVPIKTHEITCDTTATSLGNDAYILYHNSVYVKDNIVYFGLARTLADNDSGLYALGKVKDDKPLALVLSKRYTATNAAAAKSHTPLAAITVGPNVFCSFIEGAATRTNTMMRTEENNSPTRSSNAVYESIWIDAGTLEYIKDWKGFIIVSKSMPASCNIVVDARTDNASSYDTNSVFTLTSSNDYQEEGATADRYWYRDFTSLVGRSIQIRMAFTSSTTTMPILYLFSILSEQRSLL